MRGAFRSFLEIGARIGYSLRRSVGVPFPNADPGRRKIRKRIGTINIVLFVVTAFTTTLAGAFYVDGPSESWLWFFLGGWVFSVPLMSILLVHEMGHYMAGRKNHLDITPPYFLPSIPPLGTFGAFIKIRSLIPTRKVLVEVGASGPIAGAVVAIPLLAVGLFLSDIRPEVIKPTGLTLTFGSSLILEFLCLLKFGQFSFNATILMHPTAMAAWFGLFVTAMNLLPMGQLDGGHVIYALFGRRRAQLISFAAFGLMILMGVFYWQGWLVFGLLALFLGLRHPPPLDPYTPLDRSGRIIGWAAVILFFLTFVPVPITVVE